MSAAGAQKKKQADEKTQRPASNRTDIAPDGPEI